jgi:L-lactate dehydrogenase complex protein LldF
MKPSPERYLEKAREELANAHTQRFLQLLPSLLFLKRQAAYQGLPDPVASHALGIRIREEALERLPDLLEQFERNALVRGAKVFWARDSQEANEYILGLIRTHRVRYVTKGKSMVTEEMGLNEVLVRNGVQVWETDLGEFITQLLERPPFHIVGPAINVPVEQVRDVFLSSGVLKEPTTDPVALGRAAREYLRGKFHHLEMGITGVNMAVAETGTILNVENEGNIRFNKSSPRIQVSIMTIEKVVPTLADALHVLRGLCRNCTGQALGVYVTLDSGPKRPDEMDGPEELHIVILDNGRTAIFKDPEVREALRCIRCGACLNICPVYGKIGGYPYGWAYSGPMGQVLNPLLLGLDRTEHLYQSCSLCQRCKVVCPAGIDHPKILLHYRAKDAEGDPRLRGRGSPGTKTSAFKAFALAGLHPGLWGMLGKGVRLTMGMQETLWPGSVLPSPLRDWSRLRRFPRLPGRRFRDRWKKLEADFKKGNRT